MGAKPSNAINEIELRVVAKAQSIINQMGAKAQGTVNQMRPSRKAQ